MKVNENKIFNESEISNESSKECSSNTNRVTEMYSSESTEMVSTLERLNTTGMSENIDNGSISEIFESVSQSSQELAEESHDQTKRDMISKNGEYMSDEQLKMLESDETKEHLNVISSDEYTERFPDVDINVLGHCDSEGNIYMKDISPEIVEHVSTHETMHLCANREKYTNETGNQVIVSGVRESIFCEDGSFSDSNRGMNEGMTEMYTLRELNDKGKLDSAYAINSYSEARIWAERVEKLVGSEKMAAAYFGNERDELKKEFNRLNGNNYQAWENYSKDIDTLEYSDDPYKIEQAKWRLMSQYSTMAHNKYGI